MVMSPVDIAAPDLERFPRFSGARRMACVLRPGDVLFMPAFWWHEVQSYPDPMERRNLAVNFWYDNSSIAKGLVDILKVHCGFAKQKVSVKLNGEFRACVKLYL